MTTPKCEYFLVENTYVARFDREASVYEQLMPAPTPGEIVRRLNVA